MSYLRYLCLLAHSDVQHILCCVFVSFFFVLYDLVESFSDCPFLIAPSVFSNVYFHQYQQNEQNHLIPPILEQDIENPGPALGQAQHVAGFY